MLILDRILIYENYRGEEMLSMLRNWKGKVEINGIEYDSIRDVKIDDLSALDNVTIHLSSVKEKSQKTQNSVSTSDDRKQYRISVKAYMTKKATPDFDFMARWNNDNPMPLRTMIGTVEKETRGMVYMKLHGDIYADRICTCMKCGRPLTNPVSQFFGIGPECGGHNYVNPFDSEEELKAAVSAYRKQLQNIEWEGWVIKSSITESEEM